MNSALWDLTRYGANAVKEYKVNMRRLLDKLESWVVPSGVLVIWAAAPPISGCPTGALLVPEVDFLKDSLRMDIICANAFAADLVNERGLDFVDLHFFLRQQIHRRVMDGIHWDNTALRRIVNLFLTHIAEAWGHKLPGRVDFTGEPIVVVTSKKDDKAKTDKVDAADEEEDEEEEEEKMKKIRDHEKRLRDDVNHDNNKMEEEREKREKRERDDHPLKSTSSKTSAKDGTSMTSSSNGCSPTKKSSSSTSPSKRRNSSGTSQRSPSSARASSGGGSGGGETRPDSKRASSPLKPKSSSSSLAHHHYSSSSSHSRSSSSTRSPAPPRSSSPSSVARSPSLHHHHDHQHHRLDHHHSNSASRSASAYDFANDDVADVGFSPVYSQRAHAMRFGHNGGLMGPFRGHASNPASSMRHHPYARGLAGLPQFFPFGARFPIPDQSWARHFPTNRR